MSQADEQFKKQIAEFLISQNFKVSDVPRSASKTPDLLIEEGTPDATLIEIKQKGDDEQEMEAFYNEMDERGLASRSKPIGARNRLDGIIGSAVKQLHSVDPNRSLFHVIWFHCEGHDAYLHQEQLHATIYGTQKLVSENHANIITCYYFWNSSFYRHREVIDAAIVSCRGEACMWQNDHSSKFMLMKETKLAKMFGSAAVFPQLYKLSDDIMFCDHPGPRDVESITLDFLREKYELKQLQTMPMGMFEAVAPVRPKPITDSPPEAV